MARLLVVIASWMALMRTMAWLDPLTESSDAKVSLWWPWCIPGGGSSCRGCASSAVTLPTDTRVGGAFVPCSVIPICRPNRRVVRLESCCRSSQKCELGFWTRAGCAGSLGGHALRVAAVRTAVKGFIVWSVGIVGDVPRAGCLVFACSLEVNWDSVRLDAARSIIIAIGDTSLRWVDVGSEVYWVIKLRRPERHQSQQERREPQYPKRESSFRKPPR